MFFCRERHFRLVLLAPLPVLLAAASACGQSTSAPAGVFLVATLETVSVHASASPAMAGPHADVTRQVTLTTALTVPADSTTLRLSGSLDRTSPPLDSFPSAISGSPGLTDPVAAQSVSRVLCPAQGDISLFVQPAGRTDFPVRRTDNLDLDWKTSPHAASSSASASGTLEILVQAL